MKESIGSVVMTVWGGLFVLSIPMFILAGIFPALWPIVGWVYGAAGVMMALWLAVLGLHEGGWTALLVGFLIAMVAVVWGSMSPRDRNEMIYCIFHPQDSVTCPREEDQ